MAGIARLQSVPSPSLEVCFLLRISLGFLCFSLCFSNGWNQTPLLIIGPQTPPSLSLLAFLLPPSCTASSAASVNPGLSCPAVSIPSLLGEHGAAPGPLCSSGGEVKRQEKEAEREGGRETQRSWAVPQSAACARAFPSFSPINYWGKGKTRTRSLHTVANEETSVTSRVPPHRSVFLLADVSSSEKKKE